MKSLVATKRCPWHFRHAKMVVKFAQTRTFLFVVREGQGESYADDDHDNVEEFVDVLHT